jgi:curli biogenesis system outer membrane secretion channel CsgG
MNRRTLTFILCTVGLGLGGCAGFMHPSAPPLPDDAIPPCVAVASFENRSGFEGEWKIGDGMADLLVSELVKSRNFIILERGRLDSVVNEIVRQRDKLFREEGKVPAGRLKNAEYLVRGVINDFSQVEGGSLWVGIRRWLLGGGGYTARVAMTLTIVDVASGQIIDSVQCEASARARTAFMEINYKQIKFGGDQFFKTPLGIATAHAMRSGLIGITQKMPRRYWKPMIAEVTDRIIIVNGGLNRNLEVGQRYIAREAGKPVTDPATGDILQVVPGRAVGIIQITEVNETIARATAVSGAGFARGQHLESTPTPSEKGARK